MPFLKENLLTFIGSYNSDNFDEILDNLKSSAVSSETTSADSDEKKPLLVKEEELKSFLSKISKLSVDSEEKTKEKSVKEEPVESTESDDAAAAENQDLLYLKKELGFYKNRLIKKSEFESLETQDVKEFLFQRFLIKEYDKAYNTEAEERGGEEEEGGGVGVDVVDLEETQPNNFFKSLYVRARFIKKIQDDGNVVGYRYSSFLGYVRDNPEEKALSKMSTSMKSETSQEATDLDLDNALKLLDNQDRFKTWMENDAAKRILESYRAYRASIAKKIQEEKSATTIQRVLRGRFGKKKAEAKAKADADAKAKAEAEAKAKAEAEAKAKAEAEAKAKAKAEAEAKAKADADAKEGKTSVNEGDDFPKSNKGERSSDFSQNQRKLSGKRNITFEQLYREEYVKEDKNYYLIPEIKGRESEEKTLITNESDSFFISEKEDVTQYYSGLPVFNYNNLNEFSQDVEAATGVNQEKWNEENKHSLSSIACIGKGQDKRYCVVTSSQEGVTKNFISEPDFLKIVGESYSYFDASLEAAIKNTALSKALEILKTKKESLDEVGVVDDVDGIFEAIDNEIKAITLLQEHMHSLTMNSSESPELIDSLYVFNNLDIINIPRSIFNKKEISELSELKSRTVADGNHFTEALKLVLKRDAIEGINLILEEAKAGKDNDEKQTIENSKLPLEEIKQSEQIKQFDFNLFNDYLLNKSGLPSDLLKEITGKIADSFNKKTITDKESSPDFVKKLTAAKPTQIEEAKQIAKELDKRELYEKYDPKSKLRQSTEEEIEFARKLASRIHSNQMSKSVEKSIENEKIYGLDEDEVKSIAEEMLKANLSRINSGEVVSSPEIKAKVFLYQGPESKEIYQKDYEKSVRRLLKAPVPHNNVNGVGFHRPRGSSIVSIAFNFSGVKHGDDLTGNDEAYAHIDGSSNCYIGCRVCKKDGESMTVIKDGKDDAKTNYKRGDTLIYENTISFLNPKDKTYVHVKASLPELKKHLKTMSYPGSAETIMAQYNKMQIKVTSQINNARSGEEPDIERKMSVLNKGGKMCSYNGETYGNTIANKKLLNIETDHRDPNKKFVKIGKVSLQEGNTTIYAEYNETQKTYGSKPYYFNDKKKEFTDCGGFQKIKEYLIDEENVNEENAEEEVKKLKEDFEITKFITKNSINSDPETKIITPENFCCLGSGNTDNQSTKSCFDYAKSLVFGSNKDSVSGSTSTKETGTDNEKEKPNTTCSNPSAIALRLFSRAFAPGGFVR